MRVLVIGKGAREHALAWGISRSPLVDRLFVAPGNPGMRDVAEVLPVDIRDLDVLRRVVRDLGVEFVVIGPEDPIVQGVKEALEEGPVRVFSPTARVSFLEGSKVRAKQFMRKHGVPTASFQVVGRGDDLDEVVRRSTLPAVVKADGLAAGKGVTVAHTPVELRNVLEAYLLEGKFGEASRQVVVEAFLEGEEVSLFLLLDGKSLRHLGEARDYKRLLTGDRGPNTGGMGAFSPVPYVAPEVRAQIYEEVVFPTLEGLRQEGLTYTGVLYLGLMLTEEGPRVLEYNVRFGDPEAQVLIPRLDGDLLGAFLLAWEGRLEESDLRVAPDRAVVGVVLASEGYPENPHLGRPVVVRTLDDPQVHLFWAGIREEQDQWVTSGGRVVTVVAEGKTLEEARDRAYTHLSHVRFDGAQWRSDVAQNIPLQVME